jgi:hypothetical protein
MAELKTKETDASVEEFLNQVPDEETRRDCFEISRLMQQATHAEPKMWGTSIIGFGNRHLKYASGRELDWMLIGFSPRKANITLYVNCSPKRQVELLNQLGKHSAGKGCIYIKRLKDVDADVLAELINLSVQAATEPGT